MDKVIVERPRWGSRNPSRKKGYRKYISQTPVDELPKQEQMLGRWRGREKCLNEHLGPMRRFLRSNIGRPWNNVHRELCEHISVRNPVQAHVLEHIDDYVAKHVFSDNGILYTQRAHWGLFRKLEAGQMYVCPRTGLLRVLKKPKERAAPVSRLSVGAASYFRRETIWWELKFQSYPAEPVGQFEVWLNKPLAKITLAECEWLYGHKVFAISKRQLTPREAKRLRSVAAKKRKRR